MLILAHRGLPADDRPENSLDAVAAAFSLGVDGVEVDLRLTLDGELVLSHDPHLGRLTGLATDVATSTWSAMHQAAAERGVQLTRLEPVLALAAGRRVVLELKRPPGAPGASAETLAERLLALHRAGLPLDVTVSSFSGALLAAVRCRLGPGTGVRTALLGLPDHRASSVLQAALRAGHDEVHPHVLALLADPSAVVAAHSRGISVVAWTVNRRRDRRRLEELGVDALITDVPLAARADLAAARPDRALLAG